MEIDKVLLSLICVGVPMYGCVQGLGGVLKESRLTSTLFAIKAVDFFMPILWFGAMLLLPFGIVRQLQRESDWWFVFLQHLLYTIPITGLLFVLLKVRCPETYGTISVIDMVKYLWCVSLGIITMWLSFLGLLDGGMVLLVEFTQTVSSLFGK